MIFDIPLFIIRGNYCHFDNTELFKISVLHQGLNVIEIKM